MKTFSLIATIFFLYRLTDCRVIHKTQFRECENPSLEFLDSILAEFITWYNSLEQDRLKSNSKTIIEVTKSITPSAAGEWINFQNDVEVMDRSQCFIETHNTTFDNQRSICPWKYQVEERKDKYPELRRLVKCTCDRCNLIKNVKLPETIYKCMPLYESFPALKKTGCGSDGFSKWEPFLEQLPVGCYCGMDIDIIHE